MSDRAACMNCRCFAPDPHAGWVPSQYTPRYGLWEPHQHLEQGNWQISPAGWPGRCRLNPVDVPVRSSGWCGAWFANLAFMRTLEDIWVATESQKAVVQLRKELKAAQKLSLERYHRLQQRRPAKAPRDIKPTTADKSLAL